MYNKGEVKDSTLKYFKGDDLAASIWISKYCLKDENGNLLELSPDDMHKRMAKEFARIEANYPNPMPEEEIYNLLKDFKYVVPGGSQEAGIGNNLTKTSLSNCFVIDSPIDSYGGIYRTDEEQVQIMKRRGGVGHDLSNLRPSGMLANNSVLSGLAGQTLYMDRFSNSTREVAQDGRRGALMLSTHINHPDCDKFIDIKMESGRVTGANISVKITDRFMKCLEENRDFIQKFPVEIKDDWQDKLQATFISAKEQRDFDKLYVLDKGVAAKKINPKKIWDKIVKNSWKSAEPGILFWDTILRESPAGCYGKEWKETSTNPCFTGDTIVAVADGRNGVTIKELSELGCSFIVYSARENKSSGNHGKGWKAEIKEAVAFKTGFKKVIKIILSDGSEFKCTPEHLLATKDGKYIEAQNSEGIELAKFYSFSDKNSNKNYRHINSKVNGYSKQYRMIWEYYNGIYDGKIFNIDHEDNDASNDFIENLRKLSIKDHKEVTLRFGEDNPIQKIVGTERHRLMNKRKNILANSKKYSWSKEREAEALVAFDNLYGHILESLNPEDINVYLDESIYVSEIEDFGSEDVYDLTVEDNHNFYIITNSDDDKFLNCSGVLVHNCGEIPLCPYDSCRLTAVNLYSYVDFPFTDKAVFNFEKFNSHVNKSQRLMDDLIDLEIEKIDLILFKIKDDPEDWTIKEVEYKLWQKIRDKAIQGRRTGLGITAEGDMLAALGLRYGTKEATEFTIEVHKAMALESYKSSIKMSEERGTFPIWDFDKEKLNPFINRIIGEMYPQDLQKYLIFGRRNIANLTIAPVGTGSLMTQTTSGIEPLFQAFYKRRTKTEDKSKITYTDEMGDGWQEFYVIHPKFIVWFEINYWNNNYCGVGNPDSAKEWLSKCSEEKLQEYFEKSPYYKATANDIDWKASVEMQGEIQKWIDHSISKTVNLPNDATIETVDKVFRAAYYSGCKGLTIYRDGSRQGVLLTGKENKETFEYSKAFKRPVSTNCDIYHKTALKKEWMVIVGKVNNHPYEIFVIEDVENHIFPLKIEKGKVNKVKSKTYELTGINSEKVYKINNIISLMSEDEKMSTRKYSSMLRHGMHPKFIIDQIKEFASITSFDKVVQRVLENYCEAKKLVCPECGSENYHEEEGCERCPDCGFAKCG